MTKGLNVLYKGALTLNLDTTTGHSFVKPGPKQMFMLEHGKTFRKPER